MSAYNMNESIEFIKEKAIEAGKQIEESFYKEKKVELKINFADLVTEVDKSVEDFIINSIRNKYENHCFIGEEHNNSEIGTILTDEPTWIIDPIDGTTNFIHRFPYCSISIALLVNKITEFGLVYNPITKEMFTAQKGHGAYLNDTKIKVTNINDIGQSLIGAEFGSSRDAEQVDKKLENMRNIIQKAHGIRCSGSAALNLCYVACGRLDAYWEHGIHVWDIAAGEIIIREAGGITCNDQCGELDIFNRHILCGSNKNLCEQISSLIKSIPSKRD